MEASNSVFGRFEVIMVILNLINVQILLNFPRLMAEVAGTAGWLQVLYATLIALIYIYLIIKLYEAFEGKDIMSVGEYLGGGILRTFVGLIIALYIIGIMSLILREFAEDMKVISLTTSPISFVLLFFIAGMVFGAYAGLEAVVRITAIAVPVILAGFLIIVLAVSPNFDVTNILPILGTGPKAIFIDGIPRISMFSSVIILFLLYPNIKHKKEFKTIGIIGVAVSGFILMLSALSYALVIPYPTSRESFLPIYQMARLIDLGRFFQRVESIFVLIWAMAALLYLSFAFVNTLQVIQSTFKLVYYKPLILPLAIIIFTLSLLPPNLISTISLETKYIRVFSLASTFIIPLLTLVGANLKLKLTKKGGSENVQKA